LTRIKQIEKHYHQVASAEIPWVNDSKPRHEDNR